MVYNFTKADEGRYFLCSPKYRDVYFYITRVRNSVIVYRRCMLCKEMFFLYRNASDFEEDIQKQVESLLKWEFGIVTTEDFAEAPNLIECYPLDLVVLGLFRQPSKYLTKKQRQQIKDFESQINQSQKQD